LISVFANFIIILLDRRGVHGNKEASRGWDALGHGCIERWIDVAEV
jgi:hypothetical protein